MFLTLRTAKGVSCGDDPFLRRSYWWCIYSVWQKEDVRLLAMTYMIQDYGYSKADLGKH